jgi:hypothetical protein
MQYPRSKPPPFELFTDWRDGTNEGRCVQIAHGPEGWVAVRDSKDHGQGPVLRFTAEEWTAFKNGLFSGHLT